MLEDDLVTEDTEQATSPGQSPGVGPGQSPQEEEARLCSAIEAILLTSDKPVPAIRLAEGLGLVQAEAAEADQPPSRRRKAASDETPTPETGAAAVERAIDSLNAVYSDSGRAFRIEKVAGGYRLMTLPQFAPVLAAFHHSRMSSRLSRAAVETLAIIAYRQPITRAHLEAIRGVGCGEVLRSLMERRLVTIKGRAEELGRPMLYGTTREFLDAFGLASLKDLPNASDLQSG